MVALLLGTATLPSLARKKKQVKAVAVEQDTIPANDKKRFDYFFLEAIRQQGAGNYSAASTCWSMPVPSIPMRLRCIISSRCITHK